ncbi:BppU family phage baseplate upper protein [Clostridium perfringens]|uniref:BppU family phage baseplate upper protein n=1 Tax=Clostridium perfringens TaxID=1502 RepID=UPI001ABB5E95|nr:BppU family phage baseplate upper protein [Clostridium perfringens]MBO3393961.1 BppU family phage baseplate upper protein [Clostridium perfringens]MBO3399974.1 BppU family phage baseplate upper protein [Clostridium perfringens]
MSEIGLNINVDSYNNEGIKTIKGNNNAEIYKLYILKNKRRLSLVGKTVKLGYVMVGTTNGDVIENLNITNAEQGEITFPITNRISKKDGVYSCQLAIYGADGFLEHTATFGLTVEANIFTKIAGEIADSKDFTYLENILDKASKLSEKLKENTSSATNANSNLESNITEANNINSKLLENTSTATSLNKNLESNIDLAKEVKETIKDLDTKNIEATEKIETLTGLNAKAEELSNNINEALPVKDALVKNIEEAKVANTNLVATNNDAKAKKTDLDNSLEEAKKYISGLDGSQNIPQIRMDVTELQNGLKSNQALAYTGSSISADNTLEGRTEGMKIEGKTMYKKADGTYTDTWEEGVTLESFGEKEGNKISILSNGKNLFDFTKYKEKIKSIQGVVIKEDGFIADCDNSGAVGNNLLKITQILKGYFKPNCQYFFDYKVVQEGRFNGGFIYNYTDGTTSSCKFASQVGKTINYIGFTFGTQAYGGKTIFSEIMLIEGSNKPIYEPYKCDKKDILIKEPLREGDYLYEDNGQVKVYRDVKQYTFTGDENISIRGEVKENTMSFAYAVKNNKSNALLCNNFKVLGGWDKDEERIWLDGTNLMFHIQKSKLTTPDVNGFKVWLKANPTTIVYQLAEPTVEIVENCVDIDLDTFGEKTYFNILNSLPGTLDFKVPSNIASIVQSTAREVNNIWDVINNLLVPSLIDINKNVAMSTIKNNLK